LVNLCHKLKANAKAEPRKWVINQLMRLSCFRPAGLLLRCTQPDSKHRPEYDILVNRGPLYVGASPAAAKLGRLICISRIETD
jgi:hypothetical protein